MRAPVRRLLIWFSLLSSLILAVRLLLIRGLRLSVLVVDNGNEDLVPRRYPSSSQQDASGDVPTYAAGMYMAGQRPGNRSFCRWFYGLPDVLSYPPPKVTWSPEIGEKGPYRVLSFVLRGISALEKLPQVTLCTHATADQVYGIVELARRWEGPLSLAVFAPGLDADLAVALLDRACRCESAMSKVSFDSQNVRGSKSVANRHALDLLRCP